VAGREGSAVFRCVTSQQEVEFFRALGLFPVDGQLRGSDLGGSGGGGGGCVFGWWVVVGWRGVGFVVR